MQRPRMDAPPPVTVMIFTLDEEANLPTCLGALSWCDDIIVVDSFSTDRTEEIARNAGVRFFQHAFEGFGTQRNWAVANTSPKHTWILILDADERVPPEMVDELSVRLRSVPSDVGAFRVRRRFHMWGRWLRHSSLYPTWVVRLIHRDRVRYQNRGHAETQVVRGRTLELHNDLIDENQKGLSEWFERQERYARAEARHELEAEGSPFEVARFMAADPLMRRAAWRRLAARLPGRALAYFTYSYVVRGGFLDGKDGLVFCSMKAIFQQLVVVEKHDLVRSRSRGAK